MEAVEDFPYQLRYSDSNNGERCVSVDDMIEWLASLADGDFTKEQAEVVDVIMNQMILIKQKQ